MEGSTLLFGYNPPQRVNWRRLWIEFFLSGFIAFLVWLGLYLAGTNFPVEELREDTSFQPYEVDWFSRSDIYDAVRKRDAGHIKLVIYANCAFHVFDDRNRVFIVDFGESGAEPPATVAEVETYTGDTHKHPLKDLGGA